MFRLRVKMNNRAKLVVLIASTACFATIWRLSSCLSFAALEENKIDKWTDMWTKVKSCSCATCISDFTISFMKRYNRTVNPFLTPLENFTQEEFKWWKALQRENGDLKKFMEAKKRVFTMFPSKPDLTGPRLDRCRTCAVVGNSGNLKGSKYGSQIDAHDIVIRMNKAMTTGYEEDVGTKTTHRVMYPESAIDLDNNTHLVLFPFKILDLQWITDALTTGFRGQSYATVIPKIKANKNLVMVVNPVFMKYVHTSWLFSKGKYPSTGFMTLVLAMHICDELKIFGFGADKNGNWNHYWEELKNETLKTGVHPGRREYDLIQELAKQNKVTFLRGW
uniref:CMP-N-acetylneuraminate-beta-galactosamide-alpha-2,3-sialyltransferase 1 n=1 Tax=Neogobius melanostomus TaxID=47308 RepID=A0A8C6TC94_9GOBI